MSAPSESRVATAVRLQIWVRSASFLIRILDIERQFPKSGSLSGAGSFTASGGAVMLGGTSNYSGATLISGNITAGSTTGLSAASDFQVVNAGVLDLKVGIQQQYWLAEVVLVTVTNGNASAATLTTGANGNSSIFDGVLQDGAGVLALNKSGSGLLRLSGANTYTGGTTVTDGGLRVTNSSALGSGAVHAGRRRV